MNFNNRDLNISYSLCIFSFILLRWVALLQKLVIKGPSDKNNNYILEVNNILKIFIKLDYKILFALLKSLFTI